MRPEPKKTANQPRSGWDEALAAIPQDALDRDFEELRDWREAPNDWDETGWQWPETAFGESD